MEKRNSDAETGLVLGLKKSKRNVVEGASKSRGERGH